MNRLHAGDVVSWLRRAATEPWRVTAAEALGCAVHSAPTRRSVADVLRAMDAGLVALNGSPWPFERMD